MTMRTPQSFRGGTMLTSRTRRLAVMQQRHEITASAPKGAWLSRDAARNSFLFCQARFQMWADNFAKALPGRSIFVLVSALESGHPALRVSIEYRERLFNFWSFVLRQHGFHGFKNCFTIKCFHARNVIRTSVTPMDDWGSVMTEQTRDITK